MKKIIKIKKKNEVKPVIVNIDRDKRLKKKKIKIRAAVILLVIAALATVMLSPVFNIKDIKVTGNSKVKKESVLSVCGIKENLNIFKINIKQSKTLIRAIPYVDEVHIYRKLPGSVTVSVTERIPTCCIKNGTGYTLIDSKGRFLETVQENSDKLPNIVGVDEKIIKVGNTLGDKYQKNISALDELVNEFKNLGIYDRVSEINIEKADNLTFVFDGNKKIIMGERFRTDYKLMLLKATIEEIAPSEAGVIDLSKEGKALFTPVSK